MLVERYREFLWEFLNTVEADDATELKRAIKQMAVVNRTFAFRLTDAVLVEAHRVQPDAEKLAEVTGYAQHHIENRVRILDLGDVMTLPFTHNQERSPSWQIQKNQRKKGRVKRLKMSRPSRENLLTEPGQRFWLMDPVHIADKRYLRKVHRKVKNPHDRSIPSQIKWWFPEPSQ